MHHVVCTAHSDISHAVFAVSETWRAHKLQLKAEQEEREDRAASPTPSPRLSSEVRQR